MKKVVYLDNAATSAIKPESVLINTSKFIKYLSANPGRSGHRLSQKVAEKIYETRENVKEFLGAKDYDLIFTKNCTEALNLAILGTLKNGDHVIATCYCHNSVLRPLERLKNNGVEVTILDCDLQDFSHQFEKEIKPNTKLIITTFISNVTGEICDVNMVSKICRKHQIKHLVDAAQACGHLLINLKEIDCDFFAFAGHKGLLSLTGVGGLLVKSLSDLNPILFGGTGTDSSNLNQPLETVEGFEAGTIPTISILSLNEGMMFLKKNFYEILEKECKLSDYLLKNLKNQKFLTLYSKDNAKNVISFNVKNMDSGEVANRLNEDFNICVRAGLHCAPLVHKKFKTQEEGMIRVSLDFFNTFDEIDYLVRALNQIFIDGTTA